MAALLKLIKKKQDSASSGSEVVAVASNQKNKEGIHVLEPSVEKRGGLGNKDAESQVKPKKTTKNASSARNNGRPELRTKRLMREYLQISKMSGDINSCFSAELVGESLYEWNVKLLRVDPESELHQDMTELGHEHILLNLTFPDNFPFSPPFMRVVKPRIDGGFILDGGAICMELLTPSGWSSAYTVEAIIMQFAALVVKGKGRIDKRSKSDFSRKEAESSFKKLVKTHERYGWITPPISEG